MARARVVLSCHFIDGEATQVLDSQRGIRRLISKIAPKGREHVPSALTKNASAQSSATLSPHKPRELAGRDTISRFRAQFRGEPLLEALWAKPGCSS